MALIQYLGNAAAYKPEYDRATKSFKTNPLIANNTLQRKVTQGLSGLVTIPTYFAAKVGSALSPKGSSLQQGFNRVMAGINPMTYTGPNIIDLSPPPVNKPPANDLTTLQNMLNRTRTTTSGGGGGAGGYQSPELLGYGNIFDPNSYDWDSLYNPVLKAYSDAEQVARDINQLALSQIDTADLEAKNNLNQQKQQQTDLLNQAEQTTRQDEESALSRATRTFNELSQANTARFGGRSSAGLAGSEILGQNLQNTIGQVGQQTRNALANLASERRRLDTYISDKMNELDRYVTDKKQEAYTNLQNTLALINMGKGQLEADKAANRLNALQTYKANLAAIDQYNNQLKNQAINFKNQVAAQIQTSAESASNEALKYYQAFAPTIGARAAAAITGLAGTDLKSQEAQNILNLFPIGAPADSFTKVEDAIGNTGLFNPATKQFFPSSIFGGLDLQGS